MKNKIGITIVFLLLIISLIFSLIYLPYINNNSIYVVVEDKAVWRNIGGKWSNSSIRKLKRMSFNEFYSFDTKGYVGKTYLNYNEQMEVYNNNFEKISLTNGLLSIKTNTGLKNTKVAKFYNDIDDSDYPYIYKVLEKFSIKEELSITALKYTIDLNNDGKEDKIYSISNFYNGEEKDQAYSIIFSVINDNIEIIEKVVVDKNEELKTQTLYLRYIVDVDSDNNYEFIILKTSYGNSQYDCNVMYKYDSNLEKYIKLIGC